MGSWTTRRGALGAVAALALIGCGGEAARGEAHAPDGAASRPLRAPDVIFEPSPPRVVRAMLELAEVGEQDLVYDLGSGDGRIPIAAARGYGARAVGIDIDPELVDRARRNARRAGVEHLVSFRNEDLFEADFSDATVVTLFLFPDVNMKLRPKLLATLRPGTRVVSHYHDMGDWPPDKEMHVGERRIYLWIIRPRPAGS